ncbi:hypothetical protein [Glycomyces tarimensis]
MNAFESLTTFGDIARLTASLAVFGAIAFALTAKSTTHRVAAWGVAYALWFVALCVAGDGAWSSFETVLTYVLLATPALALAVASWTLPRGRRDTVTAEIGLLVLIFFAQWIMNFAHGFDHTGGVSIELLYYFLFLAAAFTAAAIPVPNRRIAYGAAALTCLLLGVFRDVLLYSETGQHPDVPFNDDILVAAVYAGIPALGVLLQIAWWAKTRRARTR